MPDGFIGSAVVSSDEPLVAIVNETNGVAAGQYQGMDSSTIADVVSFPLVKNGRANKATTFYIQNAGGSAAMIYATFTESESGLTHTTDSGSMIAAGQMWVLNPGDAGFPSGDVLGSLVVTSSVDLAGVVNEHQTAAGGPPYNVLQSTRGFSAQDADQTIVAPIFKKNFRGRSGGIQVQNVGSSTAAITVTFKHSPLSDASDTTDKVASVSGVAPGSSVTFFDDVIIGGSGGTGMADVPDGTLAAATIESDQDVVAIVNETTTGGGTLYQTTYSAMAVGNATTKIAVPLAKEEFGNKGTGIQVMNVGSTGTTIDASYVLAVDAIGTDAKTYVLEDVPVDAKGSVTLYRLSGSAGDPYTWTGDGKVESGRFGGVTIESAGGPIVAIVQETDFTDTQDKKNYEGFNLAP
jgi:hypothetical protein